MSSRFRIDWVLVDELAIGPAPRATRHLDRLQEQGIKAVLSLCDINEAPSAEGLTERFEHRRAVLPDHRAERPPEPAELQSALAALRGRRTSGPVFVHCVAALDYLIRVHPGTNQLPGQL